MAVTGSTESSGFIQILKGTWAFLNSRLFVIILIIILIIIGAGECKRIVDTNREIDIHKQNIAALTDSLKYERNKNGDLVISIDGLISSVKDLRELNKNLAKEISEQKGKVISLNTVVLRLRQDSLMLAKSLDKANKIIGKFNEIDKDTYEAGWTLPYRYDKNPKDSLNYDIFKGVTIVSIISKDPLVLRHKDSYLLNRNSSIYLVWGQKFEGNKLRVFVESPYPGLSVANMQGVLIDPSTWPNVIPMAKHHWFTGFGIGPNISTGWNIIEAKPAIIFGIGLHYNIYNF
jgi:hypothetical protein